MSSAKAQAASLSILSNAMLVAFKLVAGLVAGSASILSEAAHSAADLLAAGIAYLSVRHSDRPADEGHPFGHGKIENLSAVVEAALIIGAAAAIVYHAVQKLLAHSPVEHLGFGMGVMALSAIVNLAVSAHLSRVARATDSAALEADAQHLRVDVYTSLAVFTGLAAVAITGEVAWDPIIALGVAVLILKVAWELTRESAGHLIDRGLPPADMSRLQEILDGDSRVLGYHKVRARRSGSRRHIDLHLLLDEEMSLKMAHDLAEEVEDKIRAEFGEVDVITHIEPATDEEMAYDGRDPGIRKDRTPRSEVGGP
jgi:cation diffusion facilitator family transporter